LVATTGTFEIPQFLDASRARGIAPGSLSSKAFPPSFTYHYTNIIYSTLLSITTFIYITYLPSYVVLTFFDISDLIFTGVNAWLKLQIRLVAAIKGFNRSCLSCKKKYKYILANNINDKRANEISGADRQQECRWFTEMDEWHDNTASVRNQIPEVKLNQNLKMLFHLILHLRQQLLQHQTQQQLLHKTRRRKLKRG
jgi:hypothetical protein